MVAININPLVREKLPRSCEAKLKEYISQNGPLVIWKEYRGRAMNGDLKKKGEVVGPADFVHALSDEELDQVLNQENMAMFQLLECAVQEKRRRG